MKSILALACFAVVAVFAHPECRVANGDLFATCLGPTECVHYTTDYSDAVDVGDCHNVWHPMSSDSCPELECYDEAGMDEPGGGRCCPPDSWMRGPNLGCECSSGPKCWVSHGKLYATGLPHPVDCVHYTTNYSEAVDVDDDGRINGHDIGDVGDVCPELELYTGPVTPEGAGTCCPPDTYVSGMNIQCECFDCEHEH